MPFAHAPVRPPAGPGNRTCLRGLTGVSLGCALAACSATPAQHDASGASATAAATSPIASGSTPSAPAPPPVRFTEKLLAHVPAGVTPSDYRYVFSADGTAVAYEASQDGRAVVVTGDQPGAAYDFVSSLWMSPDGRTVAYQGTEKNRTHVVVNGEATPALNGADKMILSRDGSVTAFVAEPEPFKQSLVVDGVAGPLHSRVERLAMSDDGKTLAYVVGDGSHARVMHGSHEGPLLGDEHLWQTELVLSRDGARVAYTAGPLKGKKVVYVGDEAGPPFDGLRCLTMSDDGKTVAYVAQEGEKQVVVVNGKKGPARDTIHSVHVVDEHGAHDDCLVLSADGKTVAYAARNSGKATVFVGEHEGEAFDWTGFPVLSQDGSVFAYPAKRGGEALVVTGSAPGPTASGVSDLYVSADGRTVAYVLEKDGTRGLVVGGAAIPALGPVQRLLFAKGATPVYTMSVPNQYPKLQVIVGAEPGPIVDSVLGWRTTPDGKQMGYGALIGKEIWWKVVAVD